MTGRYEVSVWLGRHTVSVEADDPDAAIEAAIAGWVEDPVPVICAGTFEVVALEPNEVSA